MKEQISYDQFDKIDLRIGTVISVKKNEKARKPSLVVKVDFGKEIGIKQSSAQITHYYNEENLKNKQVIGVCNFAEKKYCWSCFPGFNTWCNRPRGKSCITSPFSEN